MRDKKRTYGIELVALAGIWLCFAWSMPAHRNEWIAMMKEIWEGVRVNWQRDIVAEIAARKRESQ